MSSPFYVYYYLREEMGIQKLTRRLKNSMAIEKTRRFWYISFYRKKFN